MRQNYPTGKYGNLTFPMPKCFLEYTEDYVKLGVLALTIVPKGHITRWEHQIEEAALNTIKEHQETSSK